MKLFRVVIAVSLLAITALCGKALGAPLNVVTTLPDYAVLAKAIGGERISVRAIVRGEQDAHYIRPKPSYVDMVRNADLLIDTGLDLEMWLPTVVDKSGNKAVRSGQPGYVAVSRGVKLLDKPDVISRSEGGVHVYGNPHITTSPLNMRIAAKNIALGLSKNDPAGKPFYEKALGEFTNGLDEKLFGEKLIAVLGADTLCELAETGRLFSFLENHTLDGKPLAAFLGGWMKEMAPLRGMPVVTYHENWLYFARLFALDVVGTIEPKPGIPPSPKHVLDLTRVMREQKVEIVLAANYFDEQRVITVAQRVGAVPVIVPLYVGGQSGVDDYFALVDCWVRDLLNAAQKREGTMTE